MFDLDRILHSLVFQECLTNTNTGSVCETQGSEGSEDVGGLQELQRRVELWIDANVSEEHTPSTLTSAVPYRIQNSMQIMSFIKLPWFRGVQITYIDLYSVE
jgi:hypothetical protein